MPGVYVHVPFCKSRCIYCDFYSTTHSDEWKSSFVDALLAEMEVRKGEMEGKEASTLYIGGGTPSQLPPADLQRILFAAQRTFCLKDDAEATVEANPDDVSDKWLEKLKETCTNRISLGVQSFDDKLLSLLRRRHSAQQAKEVVERCQKHGFGNLSIDLIFGIPGQTLEGWKEELNHALELGISHLSCYSMQIEEQTVLGKMVKKGTLKETDEELSLAMYEYLMEATEKAGFVHYEISNFCRPGMQSRHNSSYWTQEAYVGLGPGAHSYDGKRTRRRNLPWLKEYVSAKGLAPHEEETLTDDELYDELVFTRLRTAEGLPLNLLSDQKKAYCLEMSAVHLKNGRLLLENEVLKLSKSSIFVSDDIVSDLMS